MSNADYSPDPAPRRSRRGVYLAGLALFAIAFITFARSLTAEFIWDDDVHLTVNPCIVGPKSLLDIWTSAEARICPLTLTTFWLEYQCWGLNPMPYHLVNIVIHALNALLLWKVLNQLGARAAWLGALLWAVHPVQVETVAWVTELKNTQSGFFFLLTLIAFIRWRREKRDERQYALVLLCSLLAMASKSSTVVLPLVLGLCWWWLDREWRWRHAWRLMPSAVMSGLTALLSIWTQVVEGGIADEWDRTLGERLIACGRVVWAYLDKLLLPHPLVFIYPRWELHADQPAAYLPLALLILTALALWWWRGRVRAVFMAFACFVVLLLPVLGLVDHFFLRYSFVGDHFQYLASMAPLALAAAGLAALAERFKFSVAVKVAGTALLMALLGLLSWHHSRLFQNSFVLWKHTLANNPRCWIACSNLSNEYMMRGDVSSAVQQAQRALALNPSDITSMLNLAAIQDRLNQTDEAIATTEKALRLYEPNPQAHNNLGILHLKKGLTDQAIRDFRRSIELGATGVLPRIMLGSAWFQKANVDEAVTEWTKVIAIRPASGLAHGHLCLAFVEKQQLDRAVQHGQLAVQHEPELAFGHLALGVAMAESGRPGEAAGCYREALQKDPALFAAHFNLAQLLRLQGQLSESLEHYEAASRLFPSSGQIVAAYAWVLATCPDDSIRDVKRALNLVESVAGFTSAGEVEVLRAHAAALAAVSRFQEALVVVEQAVSVLRQASADRGAKRVTLLGLSRHGEKSDAELLEALKREAGSYRQFKTVLDPALMPAGSR